MRTFDGTDGTSKLRGGSICGGGAEYPLSKYDGLLSGYPCPKPEVL